MTMTEEPVRSVPTARRTAQHLRFSKDDDAYEHSCILTLLSSLGPLHIVLVDTPSPRGSDATLAGKGTLSEGFERFVAAPLLPRRLHAMARTV
jgi:hypothetical protein